MSRSFKLTKSHSISVHCYLLLNEAVGKHFKGSVQEEEKTSKGGGEGREIKSVFAKTMKKVGVGDNGGGDSGEGVIFTEPNEMVT